MSKTTFTINAKTLFPIDKIREHLKEAFTVSETLGPAIITKGNRPAYAIVRIGNKDQYPDQNELRQLLADQIDLARVSSRGIITTKPHR